jgi:Protein of unknown function (DUF3311)
MKKRLFWTALVVLMILHHDWWFWSDGTLLFGFLPIGLAYHAGISLAAGALWAVAAFYAMPEVFEDPKEETAS